MLRVIVLCSLVFLLVAYFSNDILKALEMHFAEKEGGYQDKDSVIKVAMYNFGKNNVSKNVINFIKLNQAIKYIDAEMVITMG